jgi:Biopolymer transport protein ExbD/TolR
MAEINSGNENRTHRRSNPKARLDMTPMVDLAFLLLTFFVVAATLAKPKVMEIIYPDNKGEGTPVNEKYACTILLGKEDGQIAYYFGTWSGMSSQLYRTSFASDGLRSVLIDWNREHIAAVSELQQKREAGVISDDEFRSQYHSLAIDGSKLTVIVKTLPETNLQSVISTMDEVKIADIHRRVVQGMSEGERAALEEIGLSETFD